VTGGAAAGSGAAAAPSRGSSWRLTRRSNIGPNASSTQIWKPFPFEMKNEAEFLRSKGTVARYSVEKGQPHRLETLAGMNATRLFDNFEETKKGCGSAK